MTYNTQKKCSTRHDDGMRGQMPENVVIAAQSSTDDTEKTTIEELTHWSETFTHQCKQEGSARVYRRYFEEILVKWSSTVFDGEDWAWGSEDLILMASGILHHIGMRDAILVSTIGWCDEVMLVDMVVHPYKKNTLAYITQVLSGMFQDAQLMPDIAKVYRAVMLLNRMTALIPEDARVPLYTCQAYIWWWLGHDEYARMFTARVLSIDAKYTLACVMYNALKVRIAPAWLVVTQKSGGMHRPFDDSSECLYVSEYLDSQSNRYLGDYLDNGEETVCMIEE